uniref:Uncharacterized protein n=1 Tax=Anguilla anguilla TaxID=7936 RepID=A0A0E9V400_ANGAN
MRVLAILKTMRQDSTVPSKIKRFRLYKSFSTLYFSMHSLNKSVVELM